jgi:hypothetical protein
MRGEDVRVFRNGRDSSEAVKSADQALDLIALFIESTVVLPGGRYGWTSGDDRNHAKFEHLLILLRRSLLHYLGVIPRSISTPWAWLLCQLVLGTVGASNALPAL